ncbi:hypothetical protein H3C61_01535 [Candidatus Gracilibacteria bacterium]|nr:hypothetical protein [Candidatus Gracilibacteria bacterium]
MYNTIEAFLENDKVIFNNKYDYLGKKSKILITFIEDENSNLYELDKNDVSKDILKGKDEILKKDKLLFTNI